MKRRTILAASFLVPLAACAPTGTTTTPSSVASDASLVAQAIATVATALSAQAAIAGAASSITAAAQTVAGYATEAATLAQQIATATAGASTSSVQGIVTLIGKVAQLVLPLIPGASSVVGIVNDLEVLVPVLLAAIGTVTPLAARPGVPDAATARMDLRRRMGMVG